MLDPKREMALETADTLMAGIPSAPLGERIEAPPARLGDRYELLGLLGAGGMGAVYRVRDTVLGEIVALKMLRPDLANDPTALARFKDEVRLARRVTHKNVARTFDIGEHESALFLTMELVEGRSLAAVLAERGALPEGEVIAIAQEIGAALAAAHAASVVHRDLKPENVLVAKDGRVVVTDFGIARARGGGERATDVIGTPQYMAPEQLEPGAAIDARTDIYALGAVIHEMLTGEPAWRADGVVALLMKRLKEREPDHPRALRADLGQAIGDVAMRCLRHDPSARFASAEEVLRALVAVTHEGTGTHRAELPAAALGARPMPRPAPSGKTVAVLPFQNGGAAEDDYLADGLADDLIDALSMTRGLLVRPRSVVARFKGVELGPQEIGRELGVQVIVEGSVRRVGSSVRLSVRLIGAADGFQLWARRFDAKVNDLLVESDSVARAIADALTTELPALERVALTDPAAVDLYLRARAEYYTSWRHRSGPAAKLFDGALALAPTDARIVAGAGLAYVRMIFFGEGEREVTLARARELTERAVALGPDFGDAWAGLAGFWLQTGDAVGAATTARAGLDRAPQSALLHELAGRLLFEGGRVRDAIARLEIALSLDPSLFAARYECARAHGLLGEWDRVDAYLEGMGAAGVSGPGPAGITAARSRLALWRGVAPPGLDPGPNTYGALECEILRTRGLSSEHREFMKRGVLGPPGRLRVLNHQRNSEVFAFVGDIDEAFASLAGAVDAELLDLAWTDLCPTMAPLRRDARWAPLRDVVAARANRVLEALR